MESATAGDVIVDATTSSPASSPVIPEEIKHIPNIENIIENVRNNPANVVVEFMKLGRALSFEKIFTAIFGSQIMLLNNLLMHPDTWKNVSEIANYQKLHQERTGSLSIELNQYLMFLQTEGLILLETNGNNQLLKITPFGIEFIRYIQQHYALNWINKSL